MISKELLSAVIGYKIIDCIDVDSDNDIEYTLEDSTCAFINIYELAYKCKEWAFKNGYSISSTIEKDNDIVFSNAFVFDSYISGYDINAGTEPEAIFQACQWIFDEKAKQ